MKIETKITLITDENKKFSIGDDIAFSINENNYKNRYIGKIIEINDKSDTKEAFIKINNVEINRRNFDEVFEIPISKMLNCNYVFES